jgi:hypothetical protein
MARVHIDNTHELWGSAVSIADLAQFTQGIKDVPSAKISVYDVHDIFAREYWHEIVPGSVEMEYPNWYRCAFKDGSEIQVGAWKEEALS